MKLLGKILITGVLGTLVLGSCSRVPFEMVDTDNLWQDNYSQLENDSTYWINCGTYNVQDPSCRLIDDTFYIFSTDAMYLDIQAQMGSWRGNQNSDRGGRGGAFGPGGGGFPGFGGFGGFGQENSRAQKSKDRVVVKREERMKIRAAMLGEDTTTTKEEEPEVVPQPGLAMGGPGMERGPMMRGGDTTGMAARRAAMEERRAQGRAQGGQQGGAATPAAPAAPGGGFPGMGGGGFPGMDAGGFGGFGGFGRRGGRSAGGMKIGDGFIQLRKSVDLANWEFAGWVFDSIPAAAQEWIKGIKGRPVNTTRAPFVCEYDGKVRLYYTLASPGFGPAFIGLAEAKSVYGPWEDKGCVIQSDFDSEAVAADPSIVEYDGKMYMYYGTSASGVYCVELNPETGLLKKAEDRGVCIAKGVEAAEVIYNEDNEFFYLFCSSGNSRNEYNVRVGRSKTPVGPFTDSQGKGVTGNSLPEVITPYAFDKHVGWIGTGHATVFQNKRGDWYIAHNGRLSNDPRILDLHLRKMIFTEEGWPIAMPERYMGEKPFKFTADEVCGGYEILRFNGNDSIPCKYLNIEIVEDDWSFDEGNQVLNLTLWNGEQLNGMMVFPGHDWERMSTSIQFVGIDEAGHTVWGKRVD